MYPKLLIFDFDGVLVDSEFLIHQILLEEIGNYGYKFNLYAFMSRFKGRTIGDIYQILKKENKIQLSEDFLSHIENQLLIKLSLRLRPTPGVVVALQALPHLKCVASNASDKRLTYLLNAAHLAEFFKDGIFSAEKVAYPKPHPDLFLYAAAHMGVSPQECLVIEDSIIGITAAKAAGIKVLGYKGVSHLEPSHNEQLLQAGAELVFKDMTDLPSLLADLYGAPKKMREKSQRLCSN